MNLAVNARDAMPSGGRLMIETSNVDLDETFTSHPVMRTPGKYVMLAVTDNGCGMDSENAGPHFRAVFYDQGKREGNRAGPCDRLRNREAERRLYLGVQRAGRGNQLSRFIFRVSRKSGKLRVLDRVPDAAAVPRGFETVLLVEDENGVRELAREYLETSGYKVIQASNGNEALELAANYKEPIHLLMTDVVMPGMSGRELADRHFRIRPDIRILFMSGYTEQAVVHHGIVAADAILLAEAVHSRHARGEIARDSALNPSCSFLRSRSPIIAFHRSMLLNDTAVWFRRSVCLI